MAVEAACGLLEVAWASGQVDAVEAALLPLQALSGVADLDRAPSSSSPCQQQVQAKSIPSGCDHIQNCFPLLLLLCFLLNTRTFLGKG